MSCGDQGRSRRAERAHNSWDLDGDGFTDEVTTEPTINHVYPPGYGGVMQVLVVDDLGRSANASASVLVEADPVRGLTARVPTATAMAADATAGDNQVDLTVTWTPGIDRPDRWVVAVDADPVGVVAGDRDHLRVALPFQEEPNGAMFGRVLPPEHPPRGGVVSARTTTPRHGRRSRGGRAGQSDGLCRSNGCGRLEAVI